MPSPDNPAYQELAECEECGEFVESVTYLVDLSGDGTLALCEDCAAWWVHHAPDAKVDEL